MTKYYLFRGFLVALLAVHLMVLYYYVSDGYVTQYYGGILLFHTPVWLIVLSISEMPLMKVKMRFPIFIGIIGVLIAVQLYIAQHQVESFYYATVFLFCLFVFDLWEKSRKPNVGEQ